MEVNKIYLGDCYQLIKQIPDKSIDCIYTDVPYLFDSHGKGHSELAERMNNKNEELIDLQDGFDYSILKDFVRVMKKINIIIWVSNLQIRDILNFFMKNGATTYRILTWHKTNPSPTTNNNWLPDTEFAIHFREKGVKVNDGYDLKQTYFISPLNKDDKDNFLHPTIKPLDLVKKHILHITDKNDTILDPFLGSGTTCVAAKELSRQYIGFEINETYYKIAKDRLNGINQKGEMSLLDTDFEQLDLFGGE